MRWSGQRADRVDVGTLPGLARLTGFVRSVRTPEFRGVTFHEVLAKSALNHVPADARMLPGEYTINPYRGCTHACQYCFARPTHTRLGLDVGGDFDNEIIVKTNIVEVLRAELARKRKLPPRVAFGTNTDVYQRAEGRYELMPGIIGALSGHRVPFSILTKGPLIRRGSAVAGARRPSGRRCTWACRCRCWTRNCSSRWSSARRRRRPGWRRSARSGTRGWSARCSCRRSCRTCRIPLQQLESLVSAVGVGGGDGCAVPPAVFVVRGQGGVLHVAAAGASVVGGRSTRGCIHRVRRRRTATRSGRGSGR